MPKKRFILAYKKSYISSFETHDIFFLWNGAEMLFIFFNISINIFQDLIL